MPPVARNRARPRRDAARRGSVRSAMASTPPTVTHAVGTPDPPQASDGLAKLRFAAAAGNMSPFPAAGLQYKLRGMIRLTDH
jgi:hypothetical protein